MHTVGVRKNLEYILLVTSIFFLMFVFYTRIEPIMICDPDDWSYVGFIRNPFPIWGYWNPAKVFPETVEGIIGSFSAFVVYPICKDYIWAFTYTFGFVLSLMLAIYFVFVGLFCERMLSLDRKIAVKISFFSFCMHFLLFRQESETVSKLIFSASNLNCFMNYTVPFLINVLLGLWVIRNFVEDEDRDNLAAAFCCNDCHVQIKWGMILLVSYFAVFSNMASNIGFIAPCMYVVCSRLLGITLKKNKFEFWKFFRQNIFYLYVFFLEVICLLFEPNGGRASDLSVDWTSACADTLRDLWGVAKQGKITVWIIIGTTIFFEIVATLRKKTTQKERKVISILLFSIGLTWVYMFLLFSRIGENKIARSENVFTLLGYLLILFSFCLSSLIKRKQELCILLVFGCGLAFAYMLGGRYEQSMSYYKGNADVAYLTNKNIIEQFIVADQLGQDEFELHIPQSGLGYYPFSGNRIAGTLYNHKIVHNIHHPILVLENDEYFVVLDSAGE